MSDWEDAPTPVTKSTVSSEWETAPIPESVSRADLIPGTPKQPVYKEPTLGEKVVGLGEAALTLGTGALAFPAGLASGLSQLTLGRGTERGGSNQAAEKTMKDVMGRYTYAPRTEVGKEAVQGMETIARESGAAGLMPGLVPHVPAMGAGATKFLQDRLPSRTKGELPAKEVSTPVVEQPVTPEITPEVPTKSTVDTTLEQWQTELSSEAHIVKPVEPVGEATAPLEGAAAPEGIPVPQEGVTEGLKPSIEAPKAEVTPGKTPLATEVTTITKGIITEADGTPAVTDAGSPRIARRNKETGEIELNPDAAKASWEASTPENKPWIKDTFDTPEKYEEFILKHEEEHALSPQKEGESTLEYEKRITKQALEKVGIVKEEPKVFKEGKLPSIYDVVDEADFHVKGKQVLKEQGPEAARKFADNYIRARGTDPILVRQNVEQFISKEVQQHGTTVNAASDLIEKGANNILANERQADLFSNSLVDRIPDAKMRDKITRALEKERESDQLNPRTDKEAISVLKEVEARLNKIGTEAKQAGLLEGLRDNYVTHILDWSKSKLSKEEQADFMQKIQEKLAAAPKDSKLVKDFTQKRQFTFLRDLEEMLATMRAQDFAGMDHGVVVHTDIAKIVNAYEKAMQTAKIHKSMIDYLKINKDVNGRPWLMKDGDAAKEAKYVSFEGKGARPLKDYRVHPDLADSMNFMFREKDPGMLVRGLGAMSHLTKALNTVGSLFHAKSLIEAGGLTSPGLMLKEIFTAGSGTKAALKALKSGDDPLIDLLIREGGLMVKVEDIQRTIVPEVGQFLDNTATKFSKLLKGPNVKLVQHITDPLDKVVLQRLNAFTWDFMHAGQKVNVAKHLFTKMKLRNPDIPDAVLAKTVGDVVNSTFGGLNWLQVANSVQNKYLKALAMKAMNTTGREWAQIVMFAPDWTVSTLRAFTNALPKELAKPKNWKLREGAKGIYNPRTKGDLARRYVVTTALSWLTLLNGINMMMSDKPIWENKDPTRVEFKDGTSMQAAKHSMEAAHWMMAPDKTLGNKLGFWPKAIFVGTTATAYPSPTAPKLKDTSALGRAKAIALLGMPFQVSSAVQAPEGETLKRAGLSTMGFPVYGVAKDKLKESQRKGRLEAKEKKLRAMMEESR